MKKLDILNNVDYSISYGVESGGFKHTKPITFNEKMECTAIKFNHEVSNFTLNNYNIGYNIIGINYDRRGNNLLGMDILSKFDIHMGVSLKTGKGTLIAVLKEQQDKTEYYNALREHFNIVEQSSVIAKLIRMFKR